jgi:hypothetical protein
MQDIIKDKHPLEMTREEKLNFRWSLILDTHYLFALILMPEAPVLHNISLFIVKQAKPVFLLYVTYEMLQDNGYLENVLKEKGYAR